MNNKPQHTFTWLKVLVPFILLEAILLSLKLNLENTLRNPSLFILLVTVPALLGLAIGLMLNFLTKFRWPVLIYIAGYVLSIFFCIVFMFVQFKDSLFVNEPPYEAGPSTVDFTIDTDDTTGPFKTDEKHAIEEVLYLMEQRYPLGAYELVDINTNSAGDGVVCTIIFTIPEESNNKYISQYIVKEGAPEPVYIKSDTTSAAYLKYKLEKTAQ